ncbi:hypothetical protein T492DRAFT_976609 [Pavlovales sp. CCMP2436]|nr:hypothetical protein T492DRAFT_976609 [Pavlovales sp. CCMP2436]
MRRRRSHSGCPSHSARSSTELGPAVLGGVLPHCASCHASSARTYSDTSSRSAETATRAPPISDARRASSAPTAAAGAPAPLARGSPSTSHGVSVSALSARAYTHTRPGKSARRPARPLRCLSDATLAGARGTSTTCRLPMLTPISSALVATITCSTPVPTSLGSWLSIELRCALGVPPV